MRNGTTWSQQAYLKASNTDPGDEFGISVAVSGDTVVVGARYERSVARGVNGDQTDHSACQAGAAYVFVRSGTAWSQQAYLKASNTVAKSSCGMSTPSSVLRWRSPARPWLSGHWRKTATRPGSTATRTITAPFGAGAAYVFVRNGTTWSQQAYLKASNTDAGDAFGWSVAVSATPWWSGHISESSNATGVNGDQDEQ